MYEDKGENYNYEKSKYCTFNFLWNDAEQKLGITKREGGFSGMEKDRIFNIVIVNPELGTGFTKSLPAKIVKYSGDAVEIICKE